MPFNYFYTINKQKPRIIIIYIKVNHGFKVFIVCSCFHISWGKRRKEGKSKTKKITNHKSLAKTNF